MKLELLPMRQGGAAENMALDFLLLQRHVQTAGRPVFRHYGWHRPAFTFGYSQKISYVRSQLPADQPVELCRRPTGGGVVDHRNDWTYTLVIPRGHPLYDDRATASYHAVHTCIAKSFQMLGEPVILKESCEPAFDGDAPCGPTVCFTHAELYDVVHETTGQKVAGAAQKRSKHGLLFQGSIARNAVSSILDWDVFSASFSDELARLLTCDLEETPWPEFAEQELDGLIEQYSSAEWNEFR